MTASAASAATQGCFRGDLFWLQEAWEFQPSEAAAVLHHLMGALALMNGGKGGKRLGAQPCSLCKSFPPGGRCRSCLPPPGLGGG